MFAELDAACALDMGEADAEIDAAPARDGDGSCERAEGDEVDAAAAADNEASCSAGTMALASTQRRAGDHSST